MRTDCPVRRLHLGFGLSFGGRNSSLKKRELVILIKPTVIRNESKVEGRFDRDAGPGAATDPRLIQPRTHDGAGFALYLKHFGLVEFRHYAGYQLYLFCSVSSGSA